MKAANEDRVCKDCSGILKGYVCSNGESFYFHWGVRYWVIKDHKPNPMPSYSPNGDKS